MPKDKPVRYRVYNGSLYSAQSFDDKGTHYSWWIDDVPALEEEPRSAEAPDIVPKLVLATLSSWQEKSRWFAAIHDTIYNDNAEIKKLVKDLTAGLKTDVEKVAALQHWSAQEIRYSGVSMGKGEGYTHHPGTMSYADRCGVCKDKAGMLITLMRTRGLRRLAGAHDGRRARRGGAGRSVQPLGGRVAPQGRHLHDARSHVGALFDRALELGGAGAELRDRDSRRGRAHDDALRPPEKHVLKVVSRGAVDKDGNLTGTLHIEGTNYMDQRMRRWLGTHKRDDLRAYVEGWLAAISPRRRSDEVRDRRSARFQEAVRAGRDVPRAALRRRRGRRRSISPLPRGSSDSAGRRCSRPRRSSISRRGSFRSSSGTRKRTNATRRSLSPPE